MHNYRKEAIEHLSNSKVYNSLLTIKAMEDSEYPPAEVWWRIDEAIEIMESKVAMTLAIMANNA